MGALLRKTKEQLFGTAEFKAGSTQQFWVLEGMSRLGDHREETSLLNPLRLCWRWSLDGQTSSEPELPPAASSRSRGSRGVLGRGRCQGVLGLEKG